VKRFERLERLERFKQGDTVKKAFHPATARSKTRHSKVAKFKIVIIMILLKNPRLRFALGASKRCRYQNSFAAGKFSPATMPRPGNERLLALKRG
jgi:hypothetical protein